jgi:adenylosuccinate lyase
MPQKRNPHKSERVCGLARIVRSQLDPTLETISLEHERDLTNSSTERITLPTAACLTHYILTEMGGVLGKLAVDEAAVAENLHAGGGRQCAERIMMALAGALGRQVAHEILKAHAGAPDFVAALKGDARVTGALPGGKLDELLDPTTYVGLAPAVVSKVVAAFGRASGGGGAAAAAVS